jgi:hypothetical protein
MILRFARGGSKPVHNSQSVHTMLANSETVGTYSLEIDNSQFTLSLCLHYIFSKYTHFWGCVSDPCELRTGADKMQIETNDFFPADYLFNQSRTHDTAGGTRGGHGQGCRAGTSAAKATCFLIKFFQNVLRISAENFEYWRISCTKNRP